MASPITWQTVNGPSIAQAAIPMESAAKLILGGFDRAGKTLDGYNTQQQGIEDRGANAKVQSFLERLQRVSSPEEVASLQASGELDTLRAGLRPQDLEKVRGAEDKRVQSLMQQTSAKNTFDDAVAKRAADPVFEAYRIAGLNGDEATQTRLLAENPNMRGWADQVEKDKALERKMKDQAFADELAPYTRDNTIAQSKLTGVQLKNAERANNDAEEERRLSIRLAGEQQKYLDQQNQQETELGKVAQRLGLPVDPSGRARVSEYTQEQKLRLDNEAILSGGLPSDTIRGSDTLTADKMLERLAKSGEFSPQAIMKNRDAIRSTFASNVSTGAVGNDAATIALNRAREKVINDERAKDNWSAPGAPDTRRNYEELAKDVPSLIDKTSGIDPEEDVADVQKLLNELAVKGIEVKKGVFVTPSTNDVRAALRQASGGWFKDSTRADNVKEYLKNIMSSPEVTKRLAEAEDLKVFKRKEAVREILNSK